LRIRSPPIRSYTPVPTTARAKRGGPDRRHRTVVGVGGPPGGRQLEAIGVDTCQETGKHDAPAVRGQRGLRSGRSCWRVPRLGRAADPLDEDEVTPRHSCRTDIHQRDPAVVPKAASAHPLQGAQRKLPYGFTRPRASRRLCGGGLPGYRPRSRHARRAGAQTPRRRVEGAAGARDPPADHQDVQRLTWRVVAAPRRARKGGTTRPAYRRPLRLPSAQATSPGASRVGHDREASGAPGLHATGEVRGVIAGAGAARR